MNATTSSPLQAPLTVTHVLAALLERLAAGRVPVGAGQHRRVAPRLVNELGDAAPGKALGEPLDSHLAAAELYANVNYQHAGLCRSALDASLAAQQQAKQVLDQAMSRVRSRSTIQPKEDPNHGKS